MAHGAPPFRRRHYFIKKDFQRGFIIKFCLLILLGVLISTGLLLLFSQNTLTSSFQHSRLVIRSTALAILPATILTSLITLALITLATIAVTLFVSHKLAGPLFRFEKEIKEIAKGDLTTEIHLRKKDQISDMALSLNHMAVSLREKVIVIRTGIAQLKKLASEQDVPQDLIDGLEDLLQKIENNFKI